MINLSCDLLQKGRQKTIESKQEILEIISNIGTSIKLTPEVHHSSDDLLVISVLQEWDTGKGIVMWFVKFRDGKAIQQITAKGDPA